MKSRRLSIIGICRKKLHIAHPFVIPVVMNTARPNALHACVLIPLVCPQVQTLIEQEVRSVLKNNETRLQGLYETIQHLERQVDYESSIKKLEVG